MELKRKFSKEYAQEERDALASGIKAKRKKYTPDWKSWNKNQAEIGDENLEQQHERLKKRFYRQTIQNPRILGE